MQAIHWAIMSSDRARTIEENLKSAASDLDEALVRLEDEAVASVALLSARAFIDVALLRLSALASKEEPRPPILRAIPRREMP